MTNAAKKTLIVAACVVVSGVCVCRLVAPRRTTITREMEYQPRVCDACGHCFDGALDPVVVACPRCGEKQGVRRYFYVCQECGHRFEAYRLRLADPEQAYDPDQPHKLVYKREGGEWVESVAALGPIACPECSSANVRAEWPK